MQKFKSVEELINQLKPEKPVYCIRKKSVSAASNFFQKNFPGEILYAVKTNPHPVVIKTLLESGINQFDVASVEEIKQVRKFSSSAKCSFMHTIKSPENIKRAYFEFGIKTFSLDTKEELIKIINNTDNAKDLELFVRIAVSNEHAEIDLSKKFGALNSEALGLLRLAKQYAKKVGLSFHVGSQCMHPISYAKGITEIGNIIKKTKIIPDYINVGGGFPSIYPDLVPDNLIAYFNEIKKSLENLKIENMPKIICEPGRALVAESGSTIVRVNLRKKQNLYINDGTYGTLFDAGTPNIVYPSKMIKENSSKIISKKMTAFSFFGPTCDSMDYMKGPFVLPNNIRENDYIELGQLGAYGLTFRTHFNGFYSDEVYEVEDDPIMSLYNRDINKDILKNPVEHIDITSFDSRPIISSMEKMSFVSRETANAANIFNERLSDKDCTIFLTLAGSTSAAGCMNIYKDLVKYNMVDAIVATGASIIDMDFFEALGFKHYQGSQFQDDTELRKNYIDRIYDTYIDEDELQMCDRIICDIADTLEPRSYTSREFIQEIGKYLKKNSKKKDSLIETAYDNNVPIFCPAFTDSSAGFGLVMHQEKNPKKHMTIDSIREFREITEIKIRSKGSGLFMIGGGVPKNFIQDTVICAELLGKEVEMHKYAVQITVADSRDGACSSSTLKEASSWGKVDITKEQMVFAEATSVLPLIASDAYHKGEWKKRDRKNFTKIFG